MAITLGFVQVTAAHRAKSHAIITAKQFGWQFKKHGLGYRGYRAFKGALRGREAGEESSFDHLGGFSLRPWDRMEDLPLKAVGTQREALEDVLKSVSSTIRKRS